MDGFDDFDDLITEDLDLCSTEWVPDDDVLDGWSEAIAETIDAEILRELDEEFFIPVPLPIAPSPIASSFPHRCPRCGGPAYIGLSNVDCEARCQT